MIKKLLIAFAMLIGLVGIAMASIIVIFPKMRPAPDLKIERTEERLKRGQYLVEHVIDCAGCHSDHLWDRFGVPTKPGTAFAGGFTFDEKFKVPGHVSAQNITPDAETGLGAWTDGEIMRAVREGVARDGRTLFPMMLYGEFRVLSDDDIMAIVAYLRTVPAIRKVIPATDIAFPASLFIRMEPKPLTEPVTAPKDGLAYGAYMARIAGCRECHTPHDDKGKKIEGREFTGGWEMIGPWGRNFTPNLTPHPDTFVGRATKEEFIGRFKSYVPLTETATASPIAEKNRNTIMPWLPLSGMSEADLGAIYDYLKSLKPIENSVNPFPDAK